MPIVAHSSPWYPKVRVEFPISGLGFGSGLGMYLSTFDASIDARGRVLVPSSFRSTLGNTQKFFLYPSADGGGYLEGGGQDLMDEYVQILKNLPPTARDRRAFVMAIFSKGGEVPMDQAGRASIPEKLLATAGIEKELLFVGAMDRFQIWNPDRYAAYEAEMSDYAEANQDALHQPFYETKGRSGPGGEL